MFQIALADRIVAPPAPYRSPSPHRIGSKPQLDTDGDGLSDWSELRRTKTDPRRRDTDGDRLSDWTEVKRVGTNPRRRDTDRDGLSDWVELRRTKTDPRRADSDADGLSDGEEVRAGSNPLRAESSSVPPSGSPDVDAGPGPAPPPADTTPPQTTITSATPPAGSNSAVFSFAANEAGASFECRLGGAAFAGCASPKEYTGLTDGGHAFEVRAIDKAGNVDQSPAVVVWTVDTVPPAIQINSGPIDLTNDPTPTFGFSSEPGAGFECSIDSGTAAFGACSGPSSHSPASPLGDGVHTFRVRAKDAAGNQATATRQFAVDTAAPDAPELTATAPPSPANDNGPLVIGDAPAGTTVKLYVGIDCTAPPVATVSVAALEAGIAVTVGDDSTTVFHATVTTAAQNTSGCSEPLTYVEDSSTPGTTITAQSAAPANSATAKFEFSGNDGIGSGVASFECRRDGGTWGGCTSPKEYVGLADEAHIFDVRAVDKAGNVDPSPASFAWSVDTAAPNTTITSRPPALTNNADASFGFSGNDGTGSGVASFQCRIDSSSPGDWAACSSPKQYAGLSDGSHTFEARAIDEAGNADQSAAAFAWTVDTTPPAAQVNSGPSGLTSNPSPTFAFSSEPGAGFECSIDEGTAVFGPCSGSGSHSPAAPLGDGAHTFRVRAKDAAGNQATATRGFEVDAGAPGTTITNQPTALTNSAVAKFEFSGSDDSGSGIASFECRRDGGAWGACTSPKEYTDLADGGHTFDVRAIDKAGNVDSSPATFGWSIDTAAPNTTITLQPAALTNSATAKFEFSGNDGSGSGIGSFECRRDGGTWGVCTSPKEYVGLAEGAHTFEVKAIDKAGNVDSSAASYGWTVDTAAPNTTITSQPTVLTSSTAAKFEFGGNDDSGSGIASFECRRDGGAWGVCTSPKEYVELTDGAHSFEVKAIDKAGNADQSVASSLWTVDTTPPAIQINSGPIDLTNDSTPTFGFGSEPGVGFECSIDEGIAAFGPCSAPNSHTPAAPLGDGAHTFRVRAKDAAGNQATATRAFTVDTAAPDAPTLTATTPSSPANNNNPLVIGDAPSSTTVKLYAGAGCTGSPLATVSVAGLKAGIPVTVGDDSTTFFHATATTAANNTSGCSEPLTYVEDSSAPGTTITAQPAAPANSATAKFEFSGNDGTGSGIASFECRRDGGAWGVCTSPREYTGLADGAHSFEVKAIDKAGNVDGSPAAFGWTVDTTPPAVQVNSGPSGLTNNPSPTFAFSSEPGAGFECSIDEGIAAFGPCSALNSHSLASPLGDGAHTFRVRAKDAAGNQATATRGFEVDAGAPGTTITSQPATLTSSAVAKFEFGGNDSSGSGIASFECRRDGGTWEACTSPKEYVGLTDGAHSFEVKAIDKAGNVDGSPATFGWSIDAAAPNTTITLQPAALTNSATAKFEFSGSDGSGSGIGSFECRRDGGTWGACTSPKEYVGLAEGAHSFEVKAIDKAGNIDQSAASVGWTVDTTSPQVQIDSGPSPISSAANTNFAFSASDSGGSGIASIECRRDAETWSACGSPKSYGSLAEGSHNFELRATDNAGNVGLLLAPYEWVIDTTAPNTTITGQPTALATSTTAKFEFSGNDGTGSGIASFECRRDGGTWGICASPKEYVGLVDGAHSFEVKAIDKAGNTDGSPASFAWSIDTAAPDTAIAFQPTSPANSATAKFEFGGNDGAGSGIGSFECRRDGGTWGVCTSPKEYTGLADGPHSFEVKAIDKAGNVDGSPASFGWSIDSVAPNTTITNQPAALTSSTAAKFEFSGNDGSGSGIASFECRRDGGTWDACTSPKEYVGPADGAHSFEVKAIDKAGNVDSSPASYGWTVDTTPPVVQIDSLSKSLLKAGQTSEVSWHAGENGAFELRLGGVGCDTGTVIESGAYSNQPATHLSNVTAAQLAEGANALRLCLTDAAGNRGQASTTLTKDTVSPDTTITLQPAAPTNSATAKFEFSGSDGAGSGVASFECRRDGGTWASCSSPKEYVALTDGAHTFEVKAIDKAGNVDGSPASFGWSIDTAAPNTTITSQPAALTKNVSAKFEFNGNDGVGSGVASFQCRIDSSNPGDWAFCSSPKEYTGLADGTHTFDGRAIDKAGNVDGSPASFGWTVDTTAPAVQIDSGPIDLTNDSTPTFGFGSEPGVGFECSIDEGIAAFGPCSAPNSHTPAAPLGDGAHTFRVRAKDAAGNQATATRAFTVDTAAPDAPTLTATTPSSPANNNNPLVIGDAPSSTTVKLYAGAGCTGSPLATVSVAGLKAGIPVTVGDDSATVFHATATTAANNTSGCSEPLVYVEDSSPPETTITLQPAAPANSAVAKFEFGGNDGSGSGIASFECRRDGGTWDACTSPKEYVGLADGAHSFEVKAIDKAGNVDGSPASFPWTVDTTPPVVQIDSLSKSLLKAGQTSEVSWHAGENGAFELRLGGTGCDTGTVVESGAYSNQPAAHLSNVTAAQLAEGANALRLCLTDAAGNRGQATTTLTKDTVSPDTQIGTKPPAFTSNTAAKFEFSGSDGTGSGVASFECRRDGGTWGGCTSPKEYVGLAEGAHTFEVKAIDKAGNVDSIPASYDWTVDMTPPAVQIGSGPVNLTNDSTPTFGFGSEPGVGFECSIDEGIAAFGPCSAPGSHTPGKPLTNGLHTFRVRATDAAGNQAGATRQFEIDITAPDNPELTATVPTSPANENVPHIFGKAIAGATVRLYTGGGCSGAPIATVSAAELEAGIAVSVPDDSTTVFSAGTTSAERTSGCSEPRVYVEDSSAPETVLSSSPPATTMSTSASFFFAANEPASFECALDGAAYESCSSPRSYADLAIGSHSFSVRAVDAAGNPEATPANWSGTIESPPASPPFACSEGGVLATTAPAVRSAVQAGHDVCVTTDVGNVNLSGLGSRPVVVSSDTGSMGDIDLDSTTDLTVSQARFRSIEMRGSHRTHLFDNTIGGTQASRVLDQLIFMPSSSNDVVIEGNDIGWTTADSSGNTGYGCRCYGDLNRLRFVGNKVHDIAADGFQGVGGTDVLIDRNEIGPVGRNPESNEHSDNIQITDNDANLRITNNWIHHQGYFEGAVTANSGSTYIHGGSADSLFFENNLIETAQGRTEICGLGTGGRERSNIAIRRNTWVDGGKAFTSFPGFEWDCGAGSGNKVERNIAIDPDGGLKMSGSAEAATFASNLWGQPSLVTLDASGSCTSVNCNPADQEPIGYRKPSGVGW